MDAFEPIRKAAAHLHDKIIAEGTDPLDTTALIIAAVDYLDLEFFWLESGDPALKNARAVFDEQSGTICCEQTEDVTKRVLLVAHELGHAHVHTGSMACTESDIDPSRSTEKVPVGLQRVEDYGTRERRELQADIFAREFLLPQSLARRLHVNEKMTASAIASRMNLPKALVRQQIFDACLLSTVEGETSTVVSTQTLISDPSQDRAVTHRDTPFLLQAGPGTGKTRTLVKRVKSLITEGIDPSSLLVLTFSNRAAGELLERLMAIVPEAAGRIWIGTFHAFGLDLIRRYHDRLGLSPDPLLLDRSDAIELLEDIFPTLPLVHYRNFWDPTIVLQDVIPAISRAKDELVDRFHYRKLAEAMRSTASDGEARIVAEKCLEIADIYDLYESVMSERGAIDFGDLIMRPVLLLESNPAIKHAVQLRHRHLLVDEYQDVNRASARLLKAVASDGKRLWVVGDARQSIYRFRGASSTNMARFCDDYPGAVIDQLATNYRSTEQIVASFVAVAPQMGASKSKDMLPLNLDADRGIGPGKPEVRYYNTPDDEVGGIAGSIRELECAGVPLRDQAVLCRSNRRLSEIATALEAYGIPSLHLGSLFEREEVRDLLALLSLAVDPFGDGLTRVGAMPRYGLSLQDAYTASRYLRDSNQPALSGIETLAKAQGISPEGASALTRLAQDLSGLSANSSAWEFLSTYLLDRTSFVRDMAQATMVTDRIRSIAVWQFLNFVREQIPGSTGLLIQRTLDRIRRLVLLAEERDLRQVPAAALRMDAVRLMTIHGSKGLEFEAVHVPGLTVSSFPTSYRGVRCPPPVGMIEGVEGFSFAKEAKLNHQHEEECLFFVALSRARTYLRLHLARQSVSGRNRSLSPFLDWLPERTIDKIVHPGVLPWPANMQSPIPIQVEQSTEWHITDSQLISYEKCPRRFFYTHILGLGGARKSTAYSQTHDCIYKLIQWVSERRREVEPTLAEAEATFDLIWSKHGPVAHTSADEYRRLALQLVGTLIRASTGWHSREAEPLAVDFPNGRVFVKPNEITDLPNKKVALYKVRPGHKRSDEYSRLDYILYTLAGQEHFGTDAVIRALHLVDGISENVPISSTRLQNHQRKINEMLTEITQGWFPPNIDEFTCPRCPHFFVCAATPRGPLTLP
ncbi:MAG: AAA family ATPase [Gemmatimonadetes bacterium]|nr:AAA family ATPase [Gemmatimonadota bacterium]